MTALQVWASAKSIEAFERGDEYAGKFYWAMYRLMGGK